MVICKQCHNQFIIYPEDKEFYQSINVPKPTLCPDCRNRRRMSMRNERVFYQRKCDYCKKNIIAYYPQESKQVVYCPECWYSDKWSPLNYGRDFNFDRSFFEQFKEMYQEVPTLSLDMINCENSEYVSYCGDDKSCYYDIAGEANERCLYGKFIKYCKDCVDNSFIYHSELCYECVNSHNCYGSTWLERCHKCDHCHYSYDLRGCSNCAYCYNLRNKSYCLFNHEYSKEDYEKKIKELKLNYQTYLNKVKNKAIIKYANITYSENCTGDDINNSKNCQNCFDVTNSENSKWLSDVLDAKECYDLNFSLYKPENSYELISTLNMINSKFCFASHYCRDMEYCDKCNNSHDCFGSIGILKGEYIIFNKKYSEKSFDKLRIKIIEHMSACGGSTVGGKKTGEYGEFFPIGTSGFKYEETIANEYFPKKIINEGEMSTSHLRSDLPICTKCQKNYKIISQEKEFYNSQNLSLPKYCPECRHQVRNIRAGVRKLFVRKCHKCQKKINTPYETEVVYCEECYNKAIY